jgi:hypothetical protein
VLRKYSFVYGLIAIGFLTTGCAKPPTTEMADAENAVNVAEGAGAAEYAPQEFRTAQDSLADARTKMEAKDYKAALAGALDAKGKAETAQAAISSGKETAKAQAMRAITVVQDKLKKLKASVAKSKGASAAGLKSSLAAIESDWTRVMEENINGNFTKVNSSIPGILGRIDDLEKKVKGPAKPAVKAKPAKHPKKK